jgi:hypothetical protein
MCRRIPIVWTARYRFRGVERRTMVYHSDRELPIAYNGLANFIGQKFTHFYFVAHMGLTSFRGNGSTSRTSLVNTLSMRALLPARPPLGRHSMNTLHTCPSLIIVLVMSLILLNKTNNVKPLSWIGGANLCYRLGVGLRVKPYVLPLSVSLKPSLLAPVAWILFYGVKPKPLEYCYPPRGCCFSTVVNQPFALFFIARGESRCLLFLIYI